MSINRGAALASCGVLLVAILAGLYLAGSPGEQRLQRFDERRVSDIRRLSVSIDSYWRGQEVLPERLAELADGHRLARIPADPESDEPYEYLGLSENSYRLCASFRRASPHADKDDFWSHPSGRHCFEFVADDDR